MAWDTPKTTWGQVGQTVPTTGDFNRIEGNINYIEKESRTPNQADTPAASGMLQKILDFFATQIKKITGKSNWYDTPATTLEAAKTHMDAPSPHSGHETVAGATAKVAAHANLTNNPHGTTKTHVQLSNVDNVKQMPIAGGTFTGQAKAQNNTAYTTLQLRNIVLWDGSGSPPATNNGDIILEYEP